ncbi:MAG TPA: fasciclin domain-containing protein [Longimicrobiales bacterium]
MKNIVEILSDDGSFHTLVAALRAAGLFEVLQTQGPFTIFAPTDNAFTGLPAGTLNALLKEPRKLTEVLLYHVIPARLLSADMISNRRMRPATLNTGTINVEVHAGSLHVNGAMLTDRDVQASNGVIHVIESVLLPLPAGLR